VISDDERRRIAAEAKAEAEADADTKNRLDKLEGRLDNFANWAKWVFMAIGGASFVKLVDYISNKWGAGQ